VRDVYILHVINHVLNTRAVIVRNNRIIKRAEALRNAQTNTTTAANTVNNKKKRKRNKKGKIQQTLCNNIDDNNAHVIVNTGLENSSKHDQRDQGFTRTTVLIILPFRCSALRVIQRILALMPAPHSSQVINKQRFLSEFEAEQKQHTHTHKKHTNPKHASAHAYDYHEQFEGNNMGEAFRIGISVTRRAVKLFADFYSADIIVASPLGLRTIIESSEIDFLSSVEILIIDGTDSLAMQNWEHVCTLVDKLNHTPTHHRGIDSTDIFRIRPVFLHGLGKYVRQTIVLGAYMHTDARLLFTRRCTNIRGAVVFKRVVEKGAITRVLSTIRQVFHRLECERIQDAYDQRFQCFVNDIFPKLLSAFDAHTLIVIPSYFDFVRVRNFFNDKVCMCVCACM